MIEQPWWAITLTVGFWKAVSFHLLYVLGIILALVIGFECGIQYNDDEYQKYLDRKKEYHDNKKD